MLRWVLLAALLLVVASLRVTAHADGPLTEDEIADELISQCGSGMILSQHNCPVARSMKVTIQQLIDADWSKEEILDYFVVAYGEDVLASPRKSGFGLAAWVAPCVAVGGGAVAMCALVWLWARHGVGATKEEGPAGPPGELRPYQKQVDQDLSLME